MADGMRLWETEFAMVKTGEISRRNLRAFGGHSERARVLFEGLGEIKGHVCGIDL